MSVKIKISKQDKIPRDGILEIHAEDKLKKCELSVVDQVTLEHVLEHSKLKEFKILIQNLNGKLKQIQDFVDYEINKKRRKSTAKNDSSHIQISNNDQDKLVYLYREMLRIFELSYNEFEELRDSDFSKDIEKTLSRRQIDCLFYLAKGLTMKQIGKVLKISPRTVENYLVVVKTKLKCNTRAELIAIALKFSKINFRLKLISE